MNTRRTKTLLEAERLEKGLSYAALGKILGVGRSSAARYCLPRSHPDHRRPEEGREGKPGPADKLRKWSGGRITAANHADKAPAPVKSQEAA